MTPPKIESDLKILCQEAKRFGAAEAVASMASAVVVDIRANLKCQVPVCPHYGNNLMCPPYIMTASEFQEILLRYTYAVLVRAEISMPEEIMQAAQTEKNIADLYKKHLKSFDLTWSKLNEFGEMISKIEAAAFKLGYRFAAGFSGGSCKLCEECAVKQPGESCRHPLKARPSMEAVGIDVFKTVEKAGIMTVATAPNKIVAYGMVLVD